MIDVYPVGLLADLQRAWRAHVTKRPDLAPVARRHSRRNLRRQVARMLSNARRGRWHELKNTLNGHLAEPAPWPDGLKRCGSGWTRKRALRSLRRHLRRAGIEQGRAAAAERMKGRA